MSSRCRSCLKVVSERHQAVSCDSCGEWQHRGCDTGWHRRLNTRAQTPPPFYVLVQLLHKEAAFVETQVKLVSNSKLGKKQRKATRVMQGKIFKVWDKYSQGNMSVDKLLSKLSRVYSK